MTPFTAFTLVTHTHSSDTAVLPTGLGMSLVSLRKYKPRRKERLLKAGNLIKGNASLTMLFYFLETNKKNLLQPKTLPANEMKSHEGFSSSWEHDVKL